MEDLLTTDGDRLLRTSQAAAQLEMSVRTLYRMIDAGRIHATKPNGGAYRIKQSEIVRVLRERSGSPQ